MIKVVASIPFNSSKERFLVLKRAETMSINSGKWNFPSGKIEDEEPLDASRRELKEETGFTGKVLKAGESFVVNSDTREFEVNPFLFLVKGDPKLNSEHTEYRWVKAEELDDLEAVEGLKKDLQQVGINVD